MRRKFEKFLVEQCAPTLAGIKPANLFRYQPEEQEDVHAAISFWNQQLGDRGVRIEVLKKYVRTGSYLILAYRRDWVTQILSKRETQAFLRQRGYLVPGHCEALMKQMSFRFKQDQSFPHEVGVLLGYPLCDVIGFIRNQGKNCACSGCWKVYGDTVAAKKYFKLLKRCTADYKGMYENGTPIVQMVESVCQQKAGTARRLWN